MTSLYQKWMYAWETRLTTRDNNRVVRPLEWGMEWARGWPLVNGNFPASEEQFEKYLHQLNDHIVANSDEFFAYETPQDFRLEKRKIELFPPAATPPTRFPKAKACSCVLPHPPARRTRKMTWQTRAGIRRKGSAP